MRIRFAAILLLVPVLAACALAREVYDDYVAYIYEEAEEMIEEMTDIPQEEPQEPPQPIFTGEPLPDHIIDFISGVSFGEDTPFDHSFLTYLTISHVGFDGESHVGHMIVAAEIGDEVLDIFRDIYEAHFPIYQMRLIDYFNADDALSLEANNSSAFNFRYIAGTTIISRHGFGLAIDINPIQNPYIRGDNIKPAAGAAYLDRDDIRPGMIIKGDPVYTAFISRGWIWGGDWTVPRDYHHFERALR